MRTALVALLLMTAALAGCSGKDGGNDDSSTTTTTASAPTSAAGSSTTAAPSPQPSAPAPKQNRAPVAALSSNATSGAAPLKVSFTLSGSDADGDALTYVLSFGDGSANQTGSLPASANHTFTGNSTVRLVVSDGKASDDATVSVSVAQAQLPAPAVFTGTATGMCQVPDPRTFDDLCLPEGSGPLQHTFTMPAGATKVVAKLDWDFQVGQATDLDLFIHDAAGEEVAAGDCANVDPAPNPAVPDAVPEVGGTKLFPCVRGTDEEAVVEGLAMATAATWTALVVPYQAPELDYTLTVTFS